MLKAYKIPVRFLFMGVAAIGLAEFTEGTAAYFALMASLTLLFAGLAYNALGGFATFSGIIFACFAIRSVVISQLAKVILGERADKNLDSPYLTISVFAVFFLFAYVGSITFARLRLPVPKPFEPTSMAHRSALYLVALILGGVATFAYEAMMDPAGKEQNGGGVQSLALAFSPLLIFAMIVAIDKRIRLSNGRHSVDFTVVVPWVILTFFGFIDTTRTTTIIATIAYLACCYVRGYKLRLRHYAALAVILGFFFVFLSPFSLYARYYTRVVGIQNRANEVMSAARSIHRLEDLRSAIEAIDSHSLGRSSREQYFDVPGTKELSRLSLIRTDSALITATKGGFHYGTRGLQIEFSRMLPSFISKNKAVAGELNFLGHVTGLAADGNDKIQIEFSAVGDAFGAFSWWGVVAMPLFGFPAIFILYESMCGDMTKPWNTVALAVCIAYFGEMNVGRLAPLLIRYPLFVLIASYMIGMMSSVLVIDKSRQTGLVPTSSPSVA